MPPLLVFCSCAQVIVCESRALKTLSMAAAAFCVASTSPGELAVFAMPCAKTPAMPSAATLSTPIANIVSTREKPA